MTEEEKKKIIKQHLDEIAKICPLRIGVFGWEEGDVIKNTSFINGEVLNLAHMLARIKEEAPEVFIVLNCIESMEKKNNDETND